MTLAVRDSPLGGRGVFTTVDIPRGAVVEDCPAIEVAPGAFGLADHVFSSPSPGRNLVLCGYGMLYNHSADPNVHIAARTPDRVLFTALRDIPAGTELLIDYGQAWWDQRGQTPV